MRILSVLTFVTLLNIPMIVRGQSPATEAIERTDKNSQLAHQQLIAKSKQGTIDAYFVGDSITRRWGATDYPQFLANWQENFRGWNTANFGWGGDTTNNILWRLQNGELEGLRPKLFVVLAGTNNIKRSSTIDDAQDIANGVLAIIKTCRDASPSAKIVVTGIFPRGDLTNANVVIAKANEILAAESMDKGFQLLDINSQLTEADGSLKEGFFPDKLHPALPAYQVWADALKPIMTEVLGKQSTSDDSPPPTGDPSATSPKQ